ncbi:class I SAM-dependent methyltransferase [Janibacter sp. G1551]|uniref:class I SAM-dependent methyltransferase n=1 Tax=Janibacter sp. G1551 TaxID=3420440 RepID=UPI003D07BE1A
MGTTLPPADTSADPAATADRLFESLIAAFDVLSVLVGDRMGWYRSLADSGPATSAQLAQRTGTQERYAREWLEQQAVTGLLHAAPAASAEDRVFTLPAGTAEAVADEHSLAFLAPSARLFGACATALPLLLDAYRSGGGVSWRQFGDDARQGQAAGNRPWYERRLAGALAEVADLDLLLARPGARILEVGSGGGWASIALARAYPGASVRGVDIDADSVAMAVRHVADAGLTARVQFTHGDAADLTAGGHDIAFAFECVHDMPRPVEVLAAARRALVPGGPLIVMDEAVAEAFGGDAGQVERLMYGFSLFMCLPDGLSVSPSVGTGAVMRPERLRAHALAAGFRDVEILPIEGFSLFRFYRLT